MNNLAKEELRLSTLRQESIQKLIEIEKKLIRTKSSRYKLLHTQSSDEEESPSESQVSNRIVMKKSASMMSTSTR